MGERPTTYSASKVKAFFAEFPFLGKYLNWKGIDFVQVKRVSDESLQKSTVDNGNGWVAIWLLDKNGNLVYRVGTQPRSEYPQCRFWSKEWWWWRLNENLDRETPADALHHLGDKVKDIYYVLEVTRVFTCELVLYKPPKDFSLESWLSEELKLAKAAVQQKLAEIDSLS